MHHGTCRAKETDPPTRSPGDCPELGRGLPGDYREITGRLSGDCLEPARGLSGDCPKLVRGLPGCSRSGGLEEGWERLGAVGSGRERPRYSRPDHASHARPSLAIPDPIRAISSGLLRPFPFIASHARPHSSLLPPILPFLAIFDCSSHAKAFPDCLRRPGHADSPRPVRPSPPSPAITGRFLYLRPCPTVFDRPGHARQLRPCPDVPDLPRQPDCLRQARPCLFSDSRFPFSRSLTGLAVSGHHPFPDGLTVPGHAVYCLPCPAVFLPAATFHAVSSLAVAPPCLSPSAAFPSLNPSLPQPFRASFAFFPRL